MSGPRPVRKRLRRLGHEYSLPYAYYVTIVTQNRQVRFGTVSGDTVHLNDAGGAADHWWRELPRKFPHVQLFEHVVMPNHLHGTIALTEGRTGEDAAPGLPAIIRWFKAMTTNAYIRLVETGAAPPYEKRLWQRGYYDHIIRDDNDWSRITEYIQANPARWAEDEVNPANLVMRAGT